MLRVDVARVTERAERVESRAQVPPARHAPRIHPGLLCPAGRRLAVPLIRTTNLQAEVTSLRTELAAAVLRAEEDARTLASQARPSV